MEVIGLCLWGIGWTKLGNCVWEGADSGVTPQDGATPRSMELLHHEGVMRPDGDMLPDGDASCRVAVWQGAAAAGNEAGRHAAGGVAQLLAWRSEKLCWLEVLRKRRVCREPWPPQIQRWVPTRLSLWTLGGFQFAHVLIQRQVKDLSCGVEKADFLPDEVGLRGEFRGEGNKAEGGIRGG